MPKILPRPKESASDQWPVGAQLACGRCACKWIIEKGDNFLVSRRFGVCQDIVMACPECGSPTTKTKTR